MSTLAIHGGTPVVRDWLSRSQLRFRKDLERRYLLETFDNGRWADWPDQESTAARFAREWAAFHTARYCALLTNGTHALQVALETLDIGAGDEVIVPGLTWQATASVVCDVNAVPILVDVQPDTFCIDPDAVAAAITPRTRAIMPVHLFHRLADMDRLLRIARRHRLHVIEDCAHCHGSRWDGRGAGSLGDLGAFSFQSSKLVNAAEGGALLTNDEDHYWRIVSQRSCGREYHPGTRVHSGNYRITALQAAILRGQLAALRRNAPIINRNGRALDAAVATAPGVRPLRRNPHITRQTGYGFAFLFDPQTWDGVTADVFRRALSSELDWSFGSTYEPLNASPVYYPHTKRRHHLNPKYRKAIDPAHWELPVATDLYRHRAVVTGWPVYGVSPARARYLTDAIVKLYEHRASLRENRARPRPARARAGRRPARRASRS